MGFEAVDKLVHEAIARALTPAGSNVYRITSSTALTTGENPKQPLVVPRTKVKTEELVKWLQENGVVEERHVLECYDRALHITPTQSFIGASCVMLNMVGN